MQKYVLIFAVVCSLFLVGCGVFQLDEENKAYIVDQNAADGDTILLAAQSCPVQAIIVYDEDGKQIYP
jgi:ferredoxin